MSGFWGVISNFGDVSNVRGKVFEKGLGFNVGEGANVRFWLDDYEGVGPLCNLFPRVYEVVSNKESFAKDFMFGWG